MTGEKALIEQRGYFWWSRQKLPRGCFAPPECTTGTVKIRDDGRTSLELDGMMAGEGSGLAALANPPGRSREAIQGKLKDGSSILLILVVGDGGSVSSRGISFQRFTASGALISQYPFKPRAEKSLIKEIVFNLEVITEWMLTGGIHLERSLRGRWLYSSIKAKYRPLAPYKYEEGNGSVAIFNFVDSTFPGTNLSEVQLKSVPYMKYGCIGISLVEVAEIRRQISDFICLLIGTAILLKQVRVVMGRREVDFYFVHSKSDDTSVKTSDCCIPYHMTAADIGPLLFEWMRKNREFGPAFYVLLGHKRLTSNYLENQFAALISGLEAFSRILDDPKASIDVHNKIAEVIKSVPNNKHKSWLRSRLRNAAEPNLQQRLYAVLSRPRLSLRESELQRFCASCMSLRHDISHFGGPRKHPDYKTFIQHAGEYTLALETLYHASILNEIGLKNEVLLYMFFQGFQSYKFRSRLSAVGFTFPAEPMPQGSEYGTG